MKKILSVIIVALCVWVITLITPINSPEENKILTIPVTIGLLAFAYFTVLCLSGEDDGVLD